MSLSANLRGQRVSAPAWDAGPPPAATQLSKKPGTGYCEGDPLSSALQSEPQRAFVVITAPQARLWLLLTSNKLTD